MSWLYSRALVAEYLEGTCSDGAPFAPSNGNPTPQAYLPPDKMTAFSRPSRFGMTFAPLTDGPGKELLTWFLAASRARTSALQEQEKGLTASVVDCGGKWHGSFVRYDHDTRLWRTHQHSLLGGLDEYSETWPRWGSMRNGECSARTASGHPTFGNESGLWPTPNCPNGGRRVPEDAEIRGGATPTAYKNGKKIQVGLEQAVKWWPTPTACGNNNRKGASATSGDGLATAVYATPTARDCKSGSFSPEAKAKRNEHRRGKPLSEQIGGSLNPTWVEWLMGWPLGWTDLKPLATDKYRNVRPKHGDYSRANNE